MNLAPARDRAPGQAAAVSSASAAASQRHTVRSDTPARPQPLAHALLSASSPPAVLAAAARPDHAAPSSTLSLINHQHPPDGPGAPRQPGRGDGRRCGSSIQRGERMTGAHHRGPDGRLHAKILADVTQTRPPPPPNKQAKGRWKRGEPASVRPRRQSAWCAGGGIRPMSNVPGPHDAAAPPWPTSLAPRRVCASWRRR